jgi:hypothetical protein
MVVERTWKEERILHTAMKLWISEDRLSHHIQICGRTGTRKSSIIRGFVDQAISRGWPCIFIDPKREYWEEYGNPARDALFDPLDTRCIRWMIGEESIDEPRGISVMDGAFPDENGKNAFFQDYARAVAGYLNGVFHPTCSELARWLVDRQEVVKRIQHTELADTLADPKNELANSIFSTINKLGRVLRWMPDDNGRRMFSVRRWAEMGSARRGHIFLCSQPSTRKALMPLHSMVMDLVLLGLQEHGAPAFVVGDEIPLLGRVPQLADAMRLLRSAGCPIMLGYQDFPSMADVYGQKQAESIVSNAYTQIVLGQNEPHTAEFSSKLLGMPTEVERQQEYKNVHWWQKHHHNSRTERVYEAAVSAGQIQSLQDGCGFLKQAGNITPIEVKWRPSRRRIVSLIPREIENTGNVIEMKPKVSRYAKKCPPSDAGCNSSLVPSSGPQHP